MPTTLENLAAHPSVRRAALIGEEPTGEWERRCRELWGLAEKRARALRGAPLEAADLTARSARLVLVSDGRLLAAALVAPSVVASVVRYELHRALESEAPRAA